MLEKIKNIFNIRFSNFSNFNDNPIINLEDTKHEVKLNIHPKYEIPYFMDIDIDSNNVNYEVSCTCDTKKGRRNKNEDLYLIHETPYGMIYGIFDGHGLVPNEIIDIVKKLIIDEQDTSKGILEKISLNVKNFLEDEGRNCGYNVSGTTASLLVLHNNKWSIGYLGDSSILQIRKYDDIYRGVMITKDHDPDNEIERNKIIEKGGMILCGRVNGYINITRSWGVYGMSQLGHDIEIYNIDVKQDDKFIIASDGLWKFLNQHQLSNIFEKSATDIVEYALNVLNSNDNVTVITIHAVNI